MGERPERVIVEQIPVGPMANFVYLVTDERSRESMVVDSGWETEPILKAIRGAGARMKFVVATHSHFDHVSTIGELASASGAKTGAHENAPLDCDVKVVDGQELKLGEAKVRVIFTPGHTSDSICLYDGREVFTGDTLFVGSIGKFERENAEEIYNSIHGVLLKLPKSTVMYPGHDYGEVKSRSLADEAASNPFLMARDFRSFASIFA